MDIWKILETEPTIDKRMIKKAYAAKTREIHPEEKPDEFQQLHEAYQAALAHVDFFLRITRGESSMRMVMDHTPDGGGIGISVAHTSDSDDEQSETENVLISYFEKQQSKADAFIKHWREFSGLYRNPEAAVWWKEYLASEEFQDVKDNVQVLHLLAEEIDDKFFYGLDEVKMLFWDAYGFQKGEEAVYQGEKQKLWKCLYPAYEKQQQNIQDKKWLAKYEKRIRIFAVASVVFLCCCIGILWRVREREEENKRRFLVDYMAQQYPDTTFSEPEWYKEYRGSYGYRMYSSAHPDLIVTAWIERRDVDGEHTYLVTEDYSRLLLKYYAQQYGLDAEVTLNSMLFYPDIEEIDTFCEKVERMFREQKELEKVSAVSIGTKSVVFPEILLQGGVMHFMLSDPQVYDLRDMDAASLAAELKEAYMLYMFQYESWNITTKQYRQWGAEYEKRSEEWVDDKGGWHEVYDPDTGEYICRFFIPTYEYCNHYYDQIPMTSRFITVGNAFYFLQDKEADITVNEDGSGFSVQFFGYNTSFGTEPEVQFYDLRECY